ncbi:hypothetical protein GCM10007902_18350 [Dyella nitratireducens]|nr:hypothetical protein GCM10007902_18350 [Dyella nitratireducens]
MLDARTSIVPDIASRTHVIGRRLAALSLLATALGMTGLAQASGGPIGGQIIGGSGQIQQVGNTTTIRQNSQTLSLNWQSFDIAPDQTVNFLQPGSGAIAINRIFSSTPSEIFGHLNANGQVWLINPNGILFGQSAQVNVGGLVASTLDFDDSTLDSSDRRFSGNGKGSIINRGSLTANNGGYIALLGNQVSNQGVVTAQLGTVAMGGGSAVTLTFSGNQVVHLQVDQSTLNNLVENRQLVVADGGRVIMTAGAKDSLLASVVNNSGRVQAQTVQNHNGEITLLGGMTAGQVNVGGTLDASAPKGGNGGAIETSGAQAHIADGAVITTKAAGGKDGTWLVDPTDFTIAASGGDITATNLETQLANGNVAFTSANGASGTSGNVNVNQAVTWSANTTLTLTASNNVNLNAAITNTGASGKTVLNAGNAFVNNAGASGLGGNWAIYSASPTATGEKLGGLAPNFIQYNAPIGTAAAATGNGVFYSLAPTLSVSGVTGTVSKTYDGTTSASLAASNLSTSGLINGDTIASAAGTYSQSDVGTGLTVTSPSSIAGFNIVNGSTPVYGYTLSGASRTANIGQIVAAQLYATIIGDPTKVYDGTTTATLTSANYYITGLAAGQSITVNQPSSVGYASADVNTNGGTTPGGGQVAVNASFTSTNFVVGSGTKLSNYILPTATSITSAALAQDATAGYGVITPAPVQLSGVLATNKTYDQTTSDTLDTSNANIYGVLSTDHVTLDKSNAVGIFASANAGNNIAVALSGFALVDTTDSAGVAATKVADYQLIAPTNLTADIARYALTVSGITANNKTYDGTTADTLNTSGAQLSPALNGDSVHLTGSATGTFSQSDAGTGLAVAVNGLSVDNSNYTVNAPTGLTANITPRVLDIEFSGSADKIYDGTNYATLSTGNFTVANVVSGQTVSVNQAPAVYSGASAPNVGTDTVTATLQSSDLNFANGAKAGNYTFNTSVVGSGHITPAPLTVTINGNPTRTYDGASDTSAPLSSGNYTLSGVIPGESITLNGPAMGNYYDTANGAAPGPGSYEGNAGTWGVVAALSSGNYTANGNTLLSNYSLPTQALGYGTITPAGLTGILVTGASGSKVYDGTNTIAITGSSTTNPGSVPLGSAVLVLGGAQAGDSGIALSASANLTGFFASANVGSQPLSVSNLTLADFTCTGCSANWQTNYTFPESVTGTGSIVAKTLYITLNGVIKQYDGNTTVLPLSNGNFTVYGYVDNNTSGTKDSGWVSGEGATITPTASFTYASPNVVRDVNGNVLSNQIGVTGTLTQNNYAANGGTLLTNYNLVYNVSGMGTITPAPLYVTGVYAQNKVYDTTNNATVNIVNGQLAGLADVDKNNSAITLTIGTTTTGSIAGNGAVTGSTVAGTFASADAGNGQTVSTLFSLGGTSAGNYNLVQPALAANITQAPLTISGIVANGKVYDGTTTATFGANNSFTFDTQNATLSGFVGADNANDVTLSATGTTGTFSTANVGNNLSVTGVNGFSLSAGTAGDKSNDYYVVNPTGLTASITPRPLSVTITGNPTKVYDGSTSATLTAGDYTIGAVAGNSNSGWVSGQGATLPQSATASYASPNVNGVNGSVVNSTLVSSDWKVDNASTLLSNYILPTTATGTGTITPYVLNLSATRVYDTTTNIYSSLSGNVTNADNANTFGTLTGLNGDQFTVTGTGATTSKNVGTYTSGAGSFTLGSLALANAGSNAGTELASNYTLVGGTDSYTITKAPLNITGASVTTKVYDGTTSATVTGATLTSGNVSGDVLTGDNVQVSSGNIAGTFNNKNAGSGKAVTISSGDITGNDAGNYAIVQPSGLTGTINQRPVTLSGVRSYDGTTTVTGNSGAITWAAPGAVAGNANSGVVSGDSVTVNGGSGSVSLANVGTYNSDGSGSGTFTATGLTLSNSNYAIASTGNQFQITPYVINFTGSSTYTGNTTVSISNGNFSNGSHAVSSTDGSFATGIGTETLTLDGPYTLANSGNASTNTTTVNAVSGDGLTLVTGSGTASNYEIGKVTYTVNPYVLSFSGSRAYDGTTNVNGSDLLDATTGSGTLGTTTFTGLNGDTFTVSGTGSLSSANKGNYGGNASGTSGTPSGTTQIGVSGLTLTGTGANAGTELASNYTFVGGNDTYDVNAKLVTIAGTRVYDGNTDANGQAGTTWQVVGVTSGDVSNVIVSGTGSVSSANIGTYDNAGTGGKQFTSSGLSLSGSASGNYTLETTGNTFTINPFVLNLTGTRTYDGTKNIYSDGTSGSSFVAITGLNGDTFTLSGEGSISAKDVNGGTAYTGSGFNLGTLALVGANAGNYTLVGGTDKYTLTPLAITVGATAANKVYSGTNTATVTSLTSGGVLAGDTVNFTDTGASFASANVAHDTNGNVIAQTVTVSGIAASGANAGDYTVNTTATTTATISPYVLSLSGTRQYDGTANVNGGDLGTLSGVNGDQFTVSGQGTSYSANAGTYSATILSGAPTSTQQIGVSGLTLNSAGANSGTELTGNYTLAGTPTNGQTDTYTISPKVLNLTGSRTYDGTKNIYSDGTSGSSFDAITGIGTDTFTLSGEGSISSKDVNGGVAYTGSGFNLGTLALVGANASNYTLVGGTDKYTLTPLAITVGATAANKVYDGTGIATVTSLTSGGVLAGDTVNFTDTGASFASANVAHDTNGNVIAQTVTVSGIAASGANAGDYTVNNTTATTTASITPLALNLTGSRTYDGTTNIYSDGTSGSSFAAITGLNGDTFTLSGEGSTSGKDVNGGTAYTGTGSTTSTTQGFNLGTLGLVAVGSANVGNYTLVGGTDSYTLTPLAITVGATAANKVYDGTGTATVTSLTSGGVLAGDTVNFTDTGASFASANVAHDTNGNVIAQTVTVSGIAASGANAGDYTVNNTATTTASITPLALNLTGSRTYDGTTNIYSNGTSGSSFAAITGLNGDTFTLSGEGSTSGKDVNGGTAYTGTGSTTSATQGFNLGTLGLVGVGSAIAGNYTLVGGTDSYTLTPLAITVGATAANKVYDGTGTATVTSLTSGGVLAGDTVNFTDTGASFASPNVAHDTNGNVIAQTVTVSGVAASGANAGDYTINTTATTTATISPYVLGFSGTRQYDGTANVNGGDLGTLSGVNGDQFTVSGQGTSYSANAGTYSATILSGAPTSTQQIGVNGLTLNNAGANSGTELAGNYTLAGTPTNGQTDRYTINPFVLNLTGTRTYDGTTNIYSDGTSGSSFAPITGLNGDTFTLSGKGSTSGKDVNGGTAYTGSGFNLGTLGLVGVGSANASNYTLVGGTDSYTLTPAMLTVVGTTVDTKTYDSTTAATLSNATLSGVLGNDQVTLGNATSGTFATPNAGTNIGVTASTMTIGGSDAGDYTLVQPTGLTGTITPVVLNLIGTRVYDGMTDANADLFGSNGVLTGVNGETVDVSGTGVLASKHVGTQPFANLGTLLLSNGTGLASNYTLVGGTDQVTVTPLAITVSATGQSKTYDANTTAGVTLASNGVFAGDTVNFHDGAATFNSPNAGNNVAIAVTGITATGADAGDYSFNNTASTSATINPYVLSLTSTRVYDGTTGADASLFGSNGVISTGVNGETVDLSGSGVLTSKNVGSQRPFANLGSLVLGNGTGLASNYTLAGGTDWVSITPATLTVIGTTTTNRVYDGTTIDALNGATLSGVFGNDDVALGNDSTGLFGDKNVGNGKAVSTAMTISGSDASNYILLQPIGLTANVTPLSITVTATGSNRQYNGKTSDVVSLSSNGVLPGDQISVADSSANFADPYVGNGKTVTVSGITASGVDAGNYVIADPVTTTTANITSAGFDGTGVQGSWIAQLQGGLQPAAIATPYGSSDDDAVGVFTGNQKMKHKPVERNRARSDFRSGLSLQLQNGGVRLPSDASP